MTVALPDLDYESWEPAKETLHLWCQIVGKTRLALTSRRNHWWNVPLYVSARGLTTSRMAVAAANLEVEIDLVGHRLRARTTDAEDGFQLVDGLSVSAFHARFREMLGGLGVHADIRAEPFGVPMTTPFPDDVEHASYDAAASRRFLEALQWSADVFEEFAGWYCGKTSPVHLFWHSFDLAVTRFSGQPAPAMPDADPVTAQAYSHEVVSFGFWPGDRVTRFPAYYSYTAPEPPGLREQPLRPSTARWVEQRGGSLALLPYDDVRAAADPRRAVLDFLQSTFEAGGSLGGWDVDTTRTDWCPVPTGGSRG
jgi:hypothetical protein